VIFVRKTLLFDSSTWIHNRRKMSLKNDIKISGHVQNAGTSTEETVLSAAISGRAASRLYLQAELEQHIMKAFAEKYVEMHFGELMGQMNQAAIVNMAMIHVAKMLVEKPGFKEGTR